jgi:DNA-binding NtrC family response regulator
MRPQPAAVRETMPAYETGAAESITCDVRFDRAQTLLNRNRAAAGERWLRAAVESARRRDNESAEARAVVLLMRRCASHGDWREARRLGTEASNRLKTWHARVAVCAELARVLISLAELSAAERLMTGLAAEAALGAGLPRLLRVRLSEIFFWQGRFEEAASHAPAGPGESSDEALVSGLVTWATGGAADLFALAELARQIGRSRLAIACFAEAHLGVGRVEDALALLRSAPQSNGAALEEALLDRLRQASNETSRPERVRPSEFVRRTGARGLERWGLRRMGVHLVHAIPALLHIVHDAEDELAALIAACGWVRSNVSADAAAFVATDQGPRLVAADGFKERDLATSRLQEVLTSAGRAVASGSTVLLSAPVRAHGSAIGLVIVQGRSEEAGSLSEAATLLASLCGPAMRGRLDAIGLATSGRKLAPEILGESVGIDAVRQAIARAAVTTFPVLIEGESGTGKELVARALHRLSGRRDRRMCAVNCAALSDELVEAELFGYVRGAFTGAVGTRPGLFEEAHGSSLLLDEVSELSARSQAKLLRTLQEREIRRLGENVPRPVDVRVLAATNRPLADEVGCGRFREDLLFRLAVVRIRLPPLRERVEDIPRIALAHWRRMLAEVGKHAVLSPDAMAALSRHLWPGNVRELQNVIAGLALAAPARGRVTERLVAQVLGDRDRQDTKVVPLDAARRDLERRLVAAALARHAGRRSAAASELGLTRQGLAKAMKRLGVAPAVDDADVA